MTETTHVQASEYHVASLVAYCTLTEIDTVKKAIEQVDGTEIHGTNDTGKIVFTIEGTSHKDIGKKMDVLRVHNGILNLSPVYHQFLDESTEQKTE
jgi:nitrate reductase NapD